MILQTVMHHWHRLQRAIWISLSVLLPMLWLSLSAHSAGTTVALVHQADAANTSGNFTKIRNNALDNNPTAIVLATARRSNPQTSHLTAPIGVWFADGAWHVFTEDRSPLPVGAEFNVVGMPRGRNAFVHTAQAANTQAHVTRIDSPELNGNAKATLQVTQVFAPDGATGVYNPHPLGVFYDGSHWCVFNQDMAPLPLGAAFNIVVGSTRTVSEEKGVLPALDTDPQRVVIVTQNWNPRGQAGVYNNSEVGVKFKAGQWAIENLGRTDIVSGASFNLLSLEASDQGFATNISQTSAASQKLQPEIALAPLVGSTSGPNLSSSEGDSISARIAVADSSVYVVWREQTASGSEIRFRASLDDGRRFADSKTLSPAGVSAVAPEVIAYGKMVFVFYLAENDVWYRRSADEGRTFQAAMNVSTDPEHAAFDLNVVADGASLFVAWAKQKSDGNAGERGLHAVRFRRIDPSGMIPIREVGSGNDSEPRLAVRGNRVVMTFASVHEGGDLDTHIGISNDRGNNWSCDENPLWGNYGDQQFAQPYILPSGNVQFTYESRPPGRVEANLEDLGSAARNPISESLIHTRFLNEGALRSGVRGLVEGNREPLALTGAVVQNELAIAWTQYDGRRRSLYLLRSGTPLEVPNNNGVDPRNAAMVSAGNELLIVFSDRSSAGTPEEIQLMRFGSVSSNTNLSETEGRSLEPQIAVNNRFVFVAWIDDTPGNFDVYFKAVPLGR